MKGYTKLIGEKGNIHMENIPDQEEVAFLFWPSTQTQNKKSITKKPASLVSKNKVARAYGKP